MAPIPTMISLKSALHIENKRSLKITTTNYTNNCKSRQTGMVSRTCCIVALNSQSNPLRQKMRRPLMITYKTLLNILNNTTEPAFYQQCGVQNFYTSTGELIKRDAFSARIPLHNNALSCHAKNHTDFSPHDRLRLAVGCIKSGNSVSVGTY